MSYISATTSKNGEEIIVWERDEAGDRITKTYPAPYYFYISDEENGNDQTIYGDAVTKVTFSNVKEYNKAKRYYKQQDIKTWESDITAELRVLSSIYYNKPAPTLHISFLDIEVDYDPNVKFSTMNETAYAPINSISIFHNWSKKLVVITVPPDDSWTAERLAAEVNIAVPNVPVPAEYKTEYIVCKNETELLLNIIEEFKDSDILCGWNSRLFDLPYIARRILKVLDKVEVSLETAETTNEYTGRTTIVYKDSPTDDIRRWGRYLKMLDVESGDGMVYFRPVIAPKTGRLLGHTIDFVGKINADYMDLYKKYEQSEKSSYRLASIEEEVELGLPKLEYEGSLATLYRKNFAFFIRYNIRDTEILYGFEQNLGYVELANQMCHISCGQFKHVYGTLKLAELAIINHCHHEDNKVVNNSDKPDIDESIDGAYVLLPQVGLHEKIGSIDIGSLYPNAIRTINISPETIRGQFNETTEAMEQISQKSSKRLTLLLDEKDENNKNIELTRSAQEWNTWLKAQKWSISGYGTVFDQSFIGVIPSIITGWITTRKKYQALQKKAEKAGNSALESYYDRLQYVYKIKLNSLYGALTNLYFRFYDLRMGESTTGTGRMVLKHQCRKVSELLDGKYDVDFPLYETIADAIAKGYTTEEANEIALRGTKFNGQFQSESVIYGDTDSTYFETHANSIQETIEIANAVAKKVNDSYSTFVQHKFLCQPEFDHFIGANREIVSDRGIFVDKKRYILHIIDTEGKTVDKMKVMGLDTKKTTLPHAVSKKLNGFIERYLKGETWDALSRDIVKYKDDLKSSPNIMDIGLPKGVNKMEEYTKAWMADPTSRLSGGAAASIHYNECLKDFDDKTSIDIKSGMKIKVFYLKPPKGRFKTIAIPTDVEVVPSWFLENFKIDKNAHIERLIDNPLTNIIKAIGEDVPTKHSLLVNDLLLF